MRYNIGTHSTEVLLDYADIRDLQISGNDVVWTQRFSNNPNADEIFHQTFLTGITTRLTTNSVPDIFPEVSNGNVVWQTFDNESTSEIFRRNLQTGDNQQLTTNS